MKKIITGHDENGKAIFMKVDSLETTVDMAVVGWREVWCSNPDDQIPVDQSDEKSRDRYSSVHPVFPKRHQSMFRVLDFKPGELNLTPEEWARAGDALPGLMEHLGKEEDPTMHVTDSIDYGVIMSGKIVLELDDGKSVELEAGDVFVQNGTIHAWRVTEPCRMAVVLVGVKRSE